MDTELGQLVWDRANGMCEYCLLQQQHSNLTFEVDHIIAISHGGATRASNLALTCFYCNRYKGPNIAGIDPVSKKLTALFNPRRQKWPRHFRYNGPVLVGRSAIARTTINVLQINNPDTVAIRQLLMDIGVFTPAK